MLQKIKMFFQKSWHVIFVLICISIVIFMGISEYKAKEAQIHVQKEISSGKLSQQELHSNGILVLCYHRVSYSNKDLSTKIALDLSNNEQLHEYTVSKGQLKRQVEYLQKHDVRIISVQKAISLIRSNQPLKHKYVVFTFDDVDRTVVDNVKPLFHEMGNLPFTVFVVTGNTGRYDNGTELATWKVLKEIIGQKNVTLGVHTNDMHYLSGNTPALKVKGNYHKFVKDYYKSEKVFKEHIGHKTPFFAYPYGEGTPREQRFLAQHGMYTFSLQNGVIQQGQDLSQPLPRTMIDSKAWNQIVKKWVEAK